MYGKQYMSTYSHSFRFQPVQSFSSAYVEIFLSKFPKQYSLESIDRILIQSLGLSMMSNISLKITNNEFQFRLQFNNQQHLLQVIEKLFILKQSLIIGRMKNKSDICQKKQKIDNVNKLPIFDFDINCYSLPNLQNYLKEKQKILQQKKHRMNENIVSNKRFKQQNNQICKNNDSKVKKDNSLRQDCGKIMDRYDDKSNSSRGQNKQKYYQRQKDEQKNKYYNNCHYRSSNYYRNRSRKQSKTKNTPSQKKQQKLKNQKTIVQTNHQTSPKQPSQYEQAQNTKTQQKTSQKINKIQHHYLNSKINPIIINQNSPSSQSQKKFIQQIEKNQNVQPDIIYYFDSPQPQSQILIKQNQTDPIINPSLQSNTKQQTIKSIKKVNQQLYQKDSQKISKQSKLNNQKGLNEFQKLILNNKKLINNILRKNSLCFINKKQSIQIGGQISRQIDNTQSLNIIDVKIKQKQDKQINMETQSDQEYQYLQNKKKINKNRRRKTNKRDDEQIQITYLIKQKLKKNKKKNLLEQTNSKE